MIGLSISAALFCFGVMILNSHGFCDSVKRGDPRVWSLVFAILNGVLAVVSMLHAIDGC